MPQETPKSASENTDAPVSYPFVEKSEAVREALGIDEKADAWKSMMSLIGEDIPKPESGVVHSQIVNRELDRRYRLISTKREVVAKAFLAVVAKVDADKPLSDIEKRAILRHFAQYIDAKNMYEHMLKGTVPSGSEVPEYLAPYILTKENVQFAIRAAEVMLPMQYDIKESAGISESPRTLAPLSYPIMMDAAKAQMSMSVVSSLLDSNNIPIADPEEYKKMLKSLGYKVIDDRSVEAAKLFVGYLGKHMPKIQQHADLSPTAKGSVGALTVPEALECCVNMPGLAEITSEIALRAPDLIRNGIPDLRGFAKEIFENSDSYPERVVQLAMKPISDLGEKPTQSDLEEYQKDVKAVMGFFLKGNSKFEAKRASVQGRERYIQTLNAKQKDMVNALCEKVCSEETLQKLLRGSFIPKDKEDRPFDIQNKAEEKLRELIIGQQLTLREAFELHYLLSAGDSASVTLAYKSVAILERHGHSAIARELQFSIFRSVTDMALADADDVTKMLDQYDLTDAQQKELRNVRLYLKESGIDVMNRVMSQMYMFVKFYPEIAWPLIALNTSGIAVGGTILLLKGLRTINIAGFEKFANMGAEAARTKYNIPKSVSVSRIEASQSEMKNLLGSYNRLGLRLHMPFSGVKSLKDMKLLLRSATSGELGEIATAMKRMYPNVNDLASELAQISNNEGDLRRALGKAGFSTTEVSSAVTYLAENDIKIGGGFGPETLSEEAQAQNTVDVLKNDLSAIDQRIADIRAKISPSKGAQRVKLLDALQTEYEAQIRNIQQQINTDPNLAEPLRNKLESAQTMVTKITGSLSSLKKRIAKNVESQAENGPADQVADPDAKGTKAGVSPGTPTDALANKSGIDQVIETKPKPGDSKGDTKGGGKFKK